MSGFKGLVGKDEFLTGWIFTREKLSGMGLFPAAGIICVCVCVHI